MMSAGSHLSHPPLHAANQINSASHCHVATSAACHPPLHACRQCMHAGTYLIQRQVPQIIQKRLP